MKTDSTPVKNFTVSAQHATTQPDTVSAELLFGGAKEIVIHHQGDTYRLRITRNDKLILTK